MAKSQTSPPPPLLPSFHHDDDGDGDGGDDDGRLLPQEAHDVLRSLAHRLWHDDIHHHSSSSTPSTNLHPNKNHISTPNPSPSRNKNYMSVRPLKGAMTNEVYECRWINGNPNNNHDHDDDHDHDDHDHDGHGDGVVHSRKRRDSHRVVLVRVYGEGVHLFFDRDDEIRTFEAVSKAGRGPRLLGRFPNGRVEEFLHARTLTATDIRDPKISAMIAAKMYDFHHLSMAGPQEPQIWHRLRDWLQKALALCSPEHIDEFRLRELGSEIDELSLRLSSRSGTNGVGFCHNDLQYGNIMLDEEDNSLTLIDYEYSSYNPIAYDIGNHFCEMAADYHTDTPHLLDYSKYPDLQERLRFIRAYMESDASPHDFLKEEEFVKEIESYTLASHLHWGLWGIISACVNGIEFDYMEYARQRFSRYYETKLKLLAE